MALVSIQKVVYVLTGFVIISLLAVSLAVLFLVIGRTAGSLLGAILVVLSQVLTPDEAYASINLPILGLLFGTIIVSVYLEREVMLFSREL